MGGTSDSNTDESSLQDDVEYIVLKQSDELSEDSEFANGSFDQLNENTILTSDFQTDQLQLVDADQATPKDADHSSPSVSNHVDEPSMSAAQEAIPDDLLCKGCHTKYDNPCLLPCLHTFCLRCLSKQTGVGSSVVTCPVDFKSHNLPSIGLTGLQPNIMTRDLLKVYDVVKGQKTILCNACLDCQEPKAVLRCSTCQIYLCAPAGVVHRKMRATYEHELCPFDGASHDEKEIGRALLEIRSSHCPPHPDQLLECFCEPCEVPICARCILGNHRGHQFKPLKDLEGSIKGTVSALSEETSKWMDAVEGGIVKANKRAEEIDQQAGELYEVVEDAVNIIAGDLEETRRAVLAGIQSSTDAKLGNLISQVKELSTLLSSSRLSLAFASNMMTSGCVADLLTHKAMIKSRLEEIVSQQIRLEPCEEADMKVFVDVDRASDAVKRFISREEIKPSKEALKLSGDLQQKTTEYLKLNEELKSARDEVAQMKKVYDKPFFAKFTMTLKAFSTITKEALKLSGDLQQKTTEYLKLNEELKSARDEVAQMKKVYDKPFFAKFTMTLKAFSTITEKTVYSEPVLLGGYFWRLSVYPSGETDGYFALFLIIANAQSLVAGWTCSVNNSLTVVNHLDPAKSIMKESTKIRFKEGAPSWGYPKFMTMAELRDPSKGFLVDDALELRATVSLA
eukprot:CAMPEP_0184369250 /NCGR_PEP_ID=MMETSP1089-20130417/162136_1 /TAXON_ID=38269 ORGANISM="Gloeochaete wittrockiana, Strain SAG46.84" /NCGR_SAMPLE_ID=MMETSP1089 /ASSEMBLY_ACC=CAM_ASM_000445 /LENGTH=679 /DNA_ID=CAMNT_0026711675 /DNA_START=66 /DNA_END=2105 /DNA_ORIENTATION=+